MKLLVAVDLSSNTEIIIEKVAEIGSKINPKIWLLHVVQPNPDFVGYDVGPQTERDFVAKKFHDKHRTLQALADRLKSRNLDATPLLIQGPTVSSILEEADDIDADMIVTGSHGHGMMYDIFIGSVSKEVLNRSERPVLIIPAKV